MIKAYLIDFYYNSHHLFIVLSHGFQVQLYNWIVPVRLLIYGTKKYQMKQFVSTAVSTV